VPGSISGGKGTAAADAASVSIGTDWYRASHVWYGSVPIARDIFLVNPVEDPVARRTGTRPGRPSPDGVSSLAIIGRPDRKLENLSSFRQKNYSGRDSHGYMKSGAATMKYYRIPSSIFGYQRSAAHRHASAIK